MFFQDHKDDFGEHPCCKPQVYQECQVIFTWFYVAFTHYEEGNTSIIDDSLFTEKETEALRLNELPKVTFLSNISSTYFPNASFSTRLVPPHTVLWSGVLVMFQIIKGSTEMKLENILCCDNRGTTERQS